MFGSECSGSGSGPVLLGLIGTRVGEKPTGSAAPRVRASCKLVNGAGLRSWCLKKRGEAPSVLLVGYRKLMALEGGEDGRVFAGQQWNC